MVRWSMPCAAPRFPTHSLFVLLRVPIALVAVSRWLLVPRSVVV